ncbi:MAG: hypothetical protein ACOYM2_10855 [Rectinemataceae bacterium]
MDSNPEQGRISSAEAPSLIDDVRSILRGSRNCAYAATNQIMVEACWNIGRRIVEEEQGGKGPS